MSQNPRARRLAERIKVIVAGLLERRIKDPRLGFVTITDVRVTGDLQAASIYYTVLGSEQDRERTAAALESAKGLIRSEVGKQIGIRLTPSIEFHLDSVPDTAAHIDAALAEATRRDAQTAALRSGSDPIQADTYRDTQADTYRDTQAGDSQRAVAGPDAQHAKRVVNDEDAVLGNDAPLRITTPVGDDIPPSEHELDEYMPGTAANYADDLERMEQLRDGSHASDVYLGDDRPVDGIDDYDD